MLVGAAGATSRDDLGTLSAPEDAPPVTLEAPDLIEPLTAFRRWRVVDGRLRSPYLPVFWDERLLVARCHRQAIAGGTTVPNHRPPYAACKCGIYAYSKPDIDFPAVDYRGVTGIVTVRGRVAIGPDGMRAESARVEALGHYTRWSARQKREVSAVADKLGVDLVDLGDLAEAAEHYGRPLLPGALASALTAEAAKAFSGSSGRG
jgi:hypothetical protein